MHTRLFGGRSAVRQLATQTSRVSFHTSLPKYDSAPFSFRPLFGIDERPSSLSSRSTSRPSAPSKAPAAEAPSNQQHHLREPRASSLASSYPRPNKKNRITFGDIHKNHTQPRPSSRASEAPKPRSPVSSHRIPDRFSQFAGAASSSQASSKNGGRSQFGMKLTHNGNEDKVRNGDRNRSEKAYEHIRLPPDDMDGRSNPSFRSKRSSKPSRKQPPLISSNDHSFQSHEDRRSLSRDRIQSASSSDFPLPGFVADEEPESAATRTRPNLSSSTSTSFANSPLASPYESRFRDLPTTSASDTRIVLDGTTFGHLIGSQTATAEEQKALSELEAILKVQDGKQRRKSWNQPKR
ncbi:hypothetical protein [Phaffia rhodozyma]|uniref:Uncharacterized protein n=1 Tax=Phaffia rhodozyma TaxID=264483 RepID=A0A0F7SRG9_PHARH|nr:hypothetical protein [Phaffia rhodozyma]